MALQQHFRNACRSSEVSVNLERGMGIEEIGVCTPSTDADLGGIYVSQSVFQHPESMITVAQTCPEVNFLCHSPACAAVSADFECPLAGGCQFRLLFGDNLSSGVQGEQMGYMAMVRVCLFKLFIPFE